jgi:hypothetical protein
MLRASNLPMVFTAVIFALAAGVYSGYGRTKAALPGVGGIEKAAIDRLFANERRGVQFVGTALDTAENVRDFPEDFWSTSRS